MNSNSKAPFLSFLQVVAVLAMPLVLIGGQVSGGLKQQEAAKFLLTPDRTVVFSGPFGESMSLPSWSNGYLVSRQLVSASPQVPNVVLYDAQGAKTREVVVWIPGSVRVILSNAVVTSDGHLVGIGVAEQSDTTQAFFIAEVDRAGAVARVIRTNPYVPMQVCTEPDGTVWTAGGVRSDDPQVRDAGEVVRHFDFNKGMTEAYLPLSSFGTKHTVAGSKGPRKEAFLGCTGDRVAFYSGASDTYAEISVSSHSVRRWKIDRSSNNLPLNGFAMTSSGEMYSSLADLEKASSADGLSYLQHDDATGSVRWSPVASSDPRTHAMSDFDYLYGADGESLVYSRREGGLGTLHWSALTRLTVANTN